MWMKDDEKSRLVAMTREEFDAMMVGKYPKIFSDRNKPMSETCMCWGFDVGPGWHPIVADLCEKIDAVGKKFGVVAVADQVKEKYAGLRFYHHVIMDDSVPHIETELPVSQSDYDVAEGIIDDLVSHAEGESYRICEVCGEYGKTYSKGGWLTAWCEKHAMENGAIGKPVTDEERRKAIEKRSKEIVKELYDNDQAIGTVLEGKKLPIDKVPFRVVVSVIESATRDIDNEE